MSRCDAETRRLWFARNQDPDKLVSQAVHLADGCHRISLSRPAPGMGDPGDLLLKSAVGLDATLAGSGAPGVRHLGLVANAQTGNVSDFCGTVSLRGRVGDLHPPFQRSPMATRGVSDAPGNDRR